MLLVERQEGHPACKKIEWWGAGVVICLERGADLHGPSGCHCHSLSLASVKSRLDFLFWYRLTRIVPDKGPINGSVYRGTVLVHSFGRQLISGAIVLIYSAL